MLDRLVCNLLMSLVLTGASCDAAPGGSDGDAGVPDGSADTDSDADSDADCIDTCGACTEGGTACCGEMLCNEWAYAGDEAYCQLDTITDDASCPASLPDYGDPCDTISLGCFYPGEGTAGADAFCTCQGWQIWWND